MVGIGARWLAIVVVLLLLVALGAVGVSRRGGVAQGVATPTAEPDLVRVNEQLRARIAQLEAQIVAMGGTPVPAPPGSEFFPATLDPGIAERDYLARVERQTTVLSDSYVILTDLLTIRESTSGDQPFRDQAAGRAADVDRVAGQAAEMAVPARYAAFHAGYLDAIAVIRAYTTAANACFQTGSETDCAAAAIAQPEALRRLQEVAAELDQLRRDAL